MILQQYGVDPNKVEVVQFATGDAADAIRSQKADAYLAAGPVNSKITSEAIAASTRDGNAPTFLAIDSAEAIAQNHPMYEASEIPAGAFGGSPDRPEDEVKTISFSHHIVARKDLSETTVAAFTRQLFAIRQTVMSEFPLAANIDARERRGERVTLNHIDEVVLLVAAIAEKRQHLRKWRGRHRDTTRHGQPLFQTCDQLRRLALPGVRIERPAVLQAKGLQFGRQERPVRRVVGRHEQWDDADIVAARERRQELVANPVLRIGQSRDRLQPACADDHEDDATAGQRIVDRAIEVVAKSLASRRVSR